MSIEELEEKIHRAVLRLMKTEGDDHCLLRRLAIKDIAAMRAKLAEMKGAAITA